MVNRNIIGQLLFKIEKNRKLQNETVVQTIGIFLEKSKNKKRAVSTMTSEKTGVTLSEMFKMLPFYIAVAAVR